MSVDSHVLPVEEGEKQGKFYVIQDSYQIAALSSFNFYVAWYKS